MDWWNDPPEYPEGPECPECGGLGDEISPNVGEDPKSGLVYQCEDCGHQWVEPPEPYDEPPPEIELTDEELEEQTRAIAEANRLCPHGKEWGECGACDHAGDLAYDSMRERLIFGR